MSIREFLEYSDGDLFYTKAVNRRRKVGDIFGGTYGGFKRANHNGVSLPISHWVFQYFNGRMPESVLFFDGDSSNTRIENIVEVPIMDRMTKEWVNFHFTYSSGNLYRRFSKRSFKAGEVVGTLRKNGYKSVMIDNKHELIHRLVWVYFNGPINKDSIDHINGVRDDNRIENLREATNQENTRNRKNAIGITYVKKARKWQAVIGIDGKSIYLGLFTLKDDALLARKNAELKYFRDFAK